MAPCSIDGCDRPVRKLGWCGTHYMRWYRHGNPGPATNLRRSSGVTLRKAFEFMPTEAVGDCQNWTRATTEAGYGEFKWGNTMVLAHRIAYELHIGPIPNGLELDHKCRNRRCVNPAHLRIATRGQNMQNLPARSDSKTGIRGVQPLGDNKWRARVKRGGIRVFDRVFDSLEEAEVAVIEARNQHFTHNVEVAH